MTDFYRFEPVMETPGPDGQAVRKGAALYLEGAITPPRGGSTGTPSATTHPRDSGSRWKPSKARS